MRRLRVLNGKKEGDTFDLDPGTHMVGTRKANDIQLRDKGIGFKHAQIVVENGRATIEDLNSKGGTWVGDDRLDKNVPVEIPPNSDIKIGTVLLTYEVEQDSTSDDAADEPAPSEDPGDEADTDTADAEPEPVVEDPAPEPVVEDPEPEPIVEDPEPEPAVEDPQPEPEPEPVAAAAEREPLPGLTSLDDLPDDADVLKERYRELERKLIEKAQEARAYEEALEAAHSGGGADDDGLGGFSDAVSGDLEQRVLDLQLVADEKTAEVLEKEDEIKALMREIDVLRSRSEEHKDRAERERQAIAEDILKGHERLEVQKQEVAEAKAEVSEFETVNAELLLETEDLKERLGSLEHLLEIERAERGKLVRERLVTLRTEIERLENSNAELRTLVEAYEEKIDELDERVEELEGESEAHESLVSELREQLTKAQHERDTMVKTLRKKLQGLERKLELAKGESARARAAAEASTGG